MNGRGPLTSQELECLEMFELFDVCGIHNELLLKSNVKRWEYKLYGGRPELYPQDRKALFAMMQFKADKIRYDEEHAEKRAAVQQKLAKMRGR